MLNVEMCNVTKGHLTRSRITGKGRAPRISHELTVCPDVHHAWLYTYKGQSRRCWECVLSSIVLWKGDYMYNWFPDYGFFKSLAWVWRWVGTKWGIFLVWKPGPTGVEGPLRWPREVVLQANVPRWRRDVKGESNPGNSSIIINLRYIWHLIYFFSVVFIKVELGNCWPLKVSVDQRDEVIWGRKFPSWSSRCCFYFPLSYLIFFICDYLKCGKLFKL